MKKFTTVAAIAALLLALSVPAFADSLGTGQPTPTPGPTTSPVGETETPTEEPTAEPTVEETEQTQARQEELADTGVNATTMAAIAVGLLLAGGFGLFAARRAGKLDN